jgi:hypothetical protein
LGCRAIEKKMFKEKQKLAAPFKKKKKEDKTSITMFMKFD